MAVVNMMRDPQEYAWSSKAMHAGAAKAVLISGMALQSTSHVYAHLDDVGVAARRARTGEVQDSRRTGGDGAPHGSHRPHGFIWTNIQPYGPKWAQLGPYGPIAAEFELMNC